MASVAPIGEGAIHLRVYKYTARSVEQRLLSAASWSNKTDKRYVRSGNTTVNLVPLCV